MSEETQLAPYEQRVIEEKRELDIKLTALEAFLEKESSVPRTESKISEINYSLLCQQVDVMQEYSSILDARVRRFTFAKNNQPEQTETKQSESDPSKMTDAEFRQAQFMGGVGDEVWD